MKKEPKFGGADIVKIIGGYFMRESNGKDVRVSLMFNRSDGGFAYQIQADFMIIVAEEDLELVSEYTGGPIDSNKYKLKH